MPFVVNPTVVLMEGVVDGILGALTVVPGAALILTPTVRLYDLPRLPNPVTDTPADYHEATFHGYAAAALTLGAPVNAGSSGRLVQADVNFILTAPAGGGATIYGAYLTNGAGDTLYAVMPFAEPAILAVAGDQLSLDAVIYELFDQAPG
jgi:hypothetical protein